MKYLKVRIAVGTSDSTFDIYYNSVNSSTRALLYDTGFPAIGLTNEVLETGEGITVLVPDNATSIVLSSNPTAFCSEVNGSNNSTFSIPLGCMSYTVSSSAGIFYYFYTDCDCIPVSATLDATTGYTEQTFCALQDSVNSGFLTIVDNGSCATDAYIITYTNNNPSQDIEVRIGNNGGSPSNTVYSGLYTSDPLTGTSVDLPAVNAIVVLTASGRIIISATCNGVTQYGTTDTITWYNVYGSLIIDFQTDSTPVTPTPTNTPTPTPTTPTPSIPLFFTFDTSGGSTRNARLYVNEIEIIDTNISYSDTIYVYAGDDIRVSISLNGCISPGGFANIYCAGFIPETVCNPSGGVLNSSTYTVTGAELTLTVQCVADCDDACA